MIPADWLPYLVHDCYGSTQCEDECRGFLLFAPSPEHAHGAGLLHPDLDEDAISVEQRPDYEPLRPFALPSGRVPLPNGRTASALLLAYREAGWSEDGRNCYCCDGGEWEAIPESVLCCYDGCGACKACAPLGCEACQEERAAAGGAP